MTTSLLKVSVLLCLAITIVGGSIASSSSETGEELFSRLLSDTDFIKTSTSTAVRSFLNYRIGKGRKDEHVEQLETEKLSAMNKFQSRLQGSSSTWEIIRNHLPRTNSTLQNRLIECSFNLSKQIYEDFELARDYGGDVPPVEKSLSSAFESLVRQDFSEAAKHLLNYVLVLNNNPVKAARRERRVHQQNVLKFAHDIAKYFFKALNGIEHSAPGPDADLVKNLTNSGYALFLKVLNGENMDINIEDYFIKNLYNPLARFLSEKLKGANNTPGPPLPDFTITGNTREEIRQDIKNTIFSGFLWLASKILEEKSELTEPGRARALIPMCIVDIIQEIPRSVFSRKSKGNGGNGIAGRQKELTSMK